MNRRCMLIILLLCVLKISCQSDEPLDEPLDELSDEDYNYEDNENNEEISVTNELNTSSIENLSKISSTISSTPLTSFTTVSTIIQTTTIQTTLETSTEESTKSSCPKNCKCSITLEIVDCSKQNLVKIPKNLPSNIIQLNLSNNLLTTLNVSDLINYSELQQLNLNNNQIETIINTDDFAKISGLHHIDLSLNALKPLHGKEFSKARKLATLILTGNKNVVATNISIVQTHKLQTLNLANCSITQLSDNIFQNLSSLLVLDLDNNPLDMPLNVEAFKYLINLRTLNVATVSQNVIFDLCKQLESIDIIHLTAETYEVSCFLLFAGSTFDDSTIIYGQTTLSSIDSDSNDLYKERKKSPPRPPRKKSTTQKPISSTIKDMVVVDPVVPLSGQQMSIFSQNETRTEKTLNGTDSMGENNGATQAKVNVPQNVIYMLLIGLIAVTLVAILIGICCRLDCCGIKTKCCRRQHNRAETEDRVQPHEEIPLNKVTTHSIPH